MQLENHSQFLTNLSPQSLTCREVEVAIRSSSAVDDCIVIQRQTEQLKQDYCAYVVPSGLFVPEQLLSYLQTILSSELIPQAIVPVSTLPLTPSGQIDETALSRLEVRDTSLVQQWSQQIQLVPEVKQVAVVVQEHQQQQQLLRPTDLLGECQTLTREENNTSIPSQFPGSTINHNWANKKLAISHGPELKREKNAPKLLGSALQKTAIEFPEKELVYIQSDGSYLSQSYKDLLLDAQKILAGLRKLGLKPLDKVIFQIDKSQDFIPAFWGCILGGFIPVPVSIAPAYEQVNSAVNKLHNAWQMLEQPVVLTSSRLAKSLRELPALLNIENFQVETVDNLRQNQPDSNIHQSQEDDLALLLLTSGSTGFPKGVMLTHRNLLSMTAGAAQNNFFSQDIFLNWMPLEHVGAIVLLGLMAVDMGCKQIHVSTEYILQNPIRWLELIQRHQATISWAPNFAFSLLNERAFDINQRSWDLSSMRFIVNGGEQIVPKTARSFLKLLQPHGLLPNAIHPAFGMSETCSVITWSDGFSLETSSDNMSFVELGLPIPGASIRIADENNQIVSEGVIGRFQVKGVSVTRGYYQNPERNREAFTEDGWFNTGDIGYLQSGRIVLTGRDKDDIIINGINYYSHEIESVVEEVEGVEISYTAACAVRLSGENADQLAIFFSSRVSEQTLLKELLKKIRGAVVKNIGVNPNYIIPVKKEMIPKTAIGKIQRVQLSKMFLAGEFDTIIQQFGINLDNSNFLQNWFYRKIWRQKVPVTLTPALNGHFLVFLDQFGLGDYLGAELQKLGQPWVGIEAGVDFKELSNNRYKIAPHNPEHYQRLLSSLKANNFQIEKIIHLWTYDSCIGEISSLESLEESQTVGVYSLLSLIQALSKVEKSHHAIELLVVSSNTQFTSQSDEIAYEKSPLLGLVKVIKQEIPGLTSRHVDLTGDETAVNAEYILQELRVLSGEQEVAYRHGQRWIPRLEKVDFGSQQKQDFGFQPSGMYLISGGLGGVGVEIAKYLLKHYKARLVLVGRTDLPERSTWDNYTVGSNTISQKIAAYQQLEELGGEIIYKAVDVCDKQRLQQVVEQAKSCWGCELDGVLHLAGTYQERSLYQESPESWSAALRAKVGGAWVLNQLLKEYPQAVFISFSSVSSFLGGATVGAFVAANQFLESFAHYQRTHCGLKSYCFNWSLWDGIGISSDYQRSKLAQTKGYYAMSAQQGLYSLLIGLYYNQVQLLVGLDGSNRYIRSYVEDTYTVEKLTAYFTASDSSVGEQLSKLVVRDRFGTPSTCNFVQLQQMPETQAGIIDLDKLTRGELHQQASDQAQPVTDVERQVARIWQEVLGVEEVGIHDNFFELGGHSLLLIQAQSKLQEFFHSSVSIVDMFKYPTISTLAKYLSQGQVESASVLQGQKRAKVRSQSQAANQSDIAVIGMSCRFPGANNINEFWQNLCNGVESISFFSDEEIIKAGVDPALVKNPNYVKAKPILSDVESFDAGFFGYSAKEAELMDPQQRLLLECAWESLEAAGYNPLTYDGAIGIYAGAVMNTYLLNNIYPNRHQLDVNDNLQVATIDSMGGLQMMVANDKDYLTTRISYKLNLTGPSVNVQTACSTSLVAIHMACASLLSGESDMALAGGVSVNVPQKIGHLYQEGMIVSPDGHCRAFDAAAKGTIFGSGAGIVVLKRLEDAQADGDHIYAVVKGSAVNNDGGTKVGYMAPNGDGQAAVVTEAMAIAGVDADTISYVEAHGTGTPLGDPIEIGGLTQAFRASTQSKNFCGIGSVKTNVGHLQIASGVVGFMKTVLSLYHKKLPPSLHFEQPNPQLDLPNTPFYVNTTLKDWHTEGYPRRAGVNSLGIGGTNAHVILEEAPVGIQNSKYPTGTPKTYKIQNEDPIERPYHLLALSAKNEQALVQLQHRYREFLTSNESVAIADVCYTANTGREHFNHRLAVVADSKEQLVEQLADLTSPKSAQSNNKSPKIAFLFTGQGSQYINMGRQLYHTQPRFRQTLEQCDEILRPYLEHSLLEILYPIQTQEQVSSLLNQTAYTQGALFAFEYALYQVWKSWGIEPDVVMGHSVGEYVAAVSAGVFSLEDGLKLVAHRGRLMQQLPSGGEMVSLMACEKRVREVIAPYDQRVALAAINGPESVVISGASEDIGAICHQLESEGVKTKRLQVSHAFHSPLMTPMLADFEAIANQVTYLKPQIPLVSNVTGQIVDAQMTTADYWVNHVCQTVRFADSMQTLHKLGYEVFLEIGPLPILLGMGRQCLPENEGLWLPSLRQGIPEWQQLLDSLAKLYVQGVNVNWSGFEQDYPHRKVALPTYPFQRQRYWIENTPREQQPQAVSGENIQTPIAKFLEQANTQELVELVQKAGNFSPEQIKLLPEILSVLVKEHKQHHLPDNIQDLCYELVWRAQPNVEQHSIADYIPAPEQMSDRSASPEEHRLKPQAQQLMLQHHQLGGEILESWLIFADNQGIGQQLRELLQAQQKACTLVFAGTEYEQIASQEFTINPALPEDFQRLIQFMRTGEHKNKSLSNPQSLIPNPQLHGVVYLWNLDAVEANNLTLTDLEVASQTGCGGVLSLIKSLINQAFSHPPTLWLVTQGAQRVGVESTVVGVAQSPVWGLGKVITNEHPEFNCTLVDLDIQGNNHAQALLTEISSHKSTISETQIAFRNGQRYVNRLVRSNKIVKKSLHLKADGTYLITGGLGEIGLLVAQWLVEHGAKYLVLAGRSSPSEASTATLRRLEEAGTQVVVMQTDVSLEKDVTTLLSKIKTSMPPLKGIIHAAGISDDRLLVNHQWQLFARVFAPKVSGAWNLHTLTQDLPLDFFVLFSSVASILGSAGIANYAAANSFLDALANYRRSVNLPGLSINWGPWSMVGMAKAVGSKGEIQWATKGIKPIEPQQALSILENILLQDAPQQGVMQLNWSKFLQQFSGPSYPSFVSEIAQQVQEVASTRVPQKNNLPQLLDQIKVNSLEQNQSLLITYLGEQIAKVLGITQSALNIYEPLNTMGLDSLMGIELRNRLRAELEIDIPVTKFLGGMNLVSLTELIGEQLFEINSISKEPFVSTVASNQNSWIEGEL